MRSFGKDSVLVVEGGGTGGYRGIKFDGIRRKCLPEEGYPDGAVSVTVVGRLLCSRRRLAALFVPPDPNRVGKPFHATGVEVGNP